MRSLSNNLWASNWIEHQSIFNVSPLTCADIRQFSGFVKVPMHLVRTLGELSQTLAMLWQLPEVKETGGTFRMVKPDATKPGKSISERLGMTYRQTRYHLERLAEAGYLTNVGKASHGILKPGFRTALWRVDSRRYESQYYLSIPRFTFRWDWYERAAYSWYLWRCSFVESKAGYMVCFDSPRFVADKLGMSERTLQRKIRSLTLRGAISVERPTKQSGFYEVWIPSTRFPSLAA